MSFFEGDLRTEERGEACCCGTRRMVRSWLSKREESEARNCVAVVASPRCSCWARVRAESVAGYYGLTYIETQSEYFSATSGIGPSFKRRQRQSFE